MKAIPMAELAVTNQTVPAFRGSLRPMTADDLGVVLDWRNHDCVRTFMFDQTPITTRQHVAWFEALQQDGSRQALVFERDGAAAGFVKFNRLQVEGVWEWGFYAAPSAPPGTGMSLASAALRHAFCALQAHKVCGRVLDLNPRSMRLHERAGFALEGVLRCQHALDGIWHDVHCFGLLQEEWLSLERTGL
jgi:hypothetical protein